MKKHLFALFTFCFAATAWAGSRSVEMRFSEMVSISHQGCRGDADCERFADDLIVKAKEKVRAMYKKGPCESFARSIGASKGSFESMHISSVDFLEGESGPRQATFLVSGDYTCKITD